MDNCGNIGEALVNCVGLALGKCVLVMDNSGNIGEALVNGDGLALGKCILVVGDCGNMVGSSQLWLSWFGAW